MVKFYAPLLSVILPTFNRVEFLPLAVESLLNQTFTDFELIIIDDCSLDNTDDIVSSYKKNDKRIKYYRNNVNSGISYNLKHGILLANSDYVAIMDDDNISYPERFEKQINYLKHNPQIAVLGTFVEYINHNAEIITEIPRLSAFEDISLWINFFNPVITSTIMLNKKLLFKHNINYLSSLKYSYDYFFIQEVISNNLKVENLPEILLKYVCHPRQFTSDTECIKNKKVSNYNIQCGLLKKFFNNNDDMYYVKKAIGNYPFKVEDRDKVITALNLIKEKNDMLNIYDNKTIEKLFVF